MQIQLHVFSFLALYIAFLNKLLNFNCSAQTTKMNLYASNGNHSNIETVASLLIRKKKKKADKRRAGKDFIKE